MMGSPFHFDGERRHPRPENAPTHSLIAFSKTRAHLIRTCDFLKYFMRAEFTAACFLSGLLMGCGGEDAPQLVKVAGQVMQGGKPVTAGSINFYPSGSNVYTKDNPSSILQIDGTFNMKTFPFGEGVSPGRYKVTLAPELAARLSRPAYAVPQTTPWEVLVPDAGLKNHLFEVK